MTGPQFDIQIGKDGTIKLRVEGVSGVECVALSDMLKELIGKEEHRELTPEYYGGAGKVRTDGNVQGRVTR